MSGTLAAGGIIPPRPGGVPYSFGTDLPEVVIPLSHPHTFEHNP